ncbi:MAG: LytTR family DNA-binding domain-containing protein [Bacteroidota bacterium]
MTPRTCIIVDDEPMAVKVLESHFSQLPSWRVSQTFTSASAATDYLQRHRADLLLLDIQMPGLSGLHLLGSLPHPIPTILTTAHREYALESYEFQVVDYLLKPIGIDRLLKALAKLPATKETATQPTASSTLPPSDFIYLKSDRQYVKVQLSEILYVEALKNHLLIHCRDKRYTTLMTLGELADKLPSDQFMRCHRSFLLSLAHIESFDHSGVHIQGQRLPLGRLYKQQVLERLRGFVV